MFLHFSGEKKLANALGLCFLFIHGSQVGVNICISFTASSIWSTPNTLGNIGKNPVEEHGTFFWNTDLSEESGNRGTYEKEVTQYIKKIVNNILTEIYLIIC